MKTGTIQDNLKYELAITQRGRLQRTQTEPVLPNGGQKFPHFNTVHFPYNYITYTIHYTHSTTQYYITLYYITHTIFTTNLPIYFVHSRDISGYVFLDYFRGI